MKGVRKSVCFYRNVQGQAHAALPAVNSTTFPGKTSPCMV